MSIIRMLPPAINLLAASSRLLDLHQSRRGESGVYVPTVPDGAGRNVGIALIVLEILRYIELDQGFGFVTVDEIHQQLSQRVSNIEPTELEFVLESIAQEREIHYAIPGDSLEFDYGSTRQTTNLIIFADSRAQVKLTENGRLFLRICDEEQAWLYTGADASKLITALKNSKFYDLPSLCRGISNDLMSKNARLIDLLERPTRKEQCEILIADGDAIGEDLKTSKLTVQEAMKLAFDERTFDAFEEWNAKAKADFSLGNIQAELEVLLKIIETISRRFIDFLKVAQEQKDVSVTEIHFLDIADKFVLDCDERSSDRLESFLSSILFPYFSVPFFHPSLLPGEVDFYDLMDQGDGDKPRNRQFDLSRDDAEPVKRFREFVDRHKEKILERLSVGPMSFSEFLTTDTFPLKPGETPLDFLGIYTTPEVLGDNTRHVVVGFTENRIHQKFESVTIIADDPLIFLMEG